MQLFPLFFFYFHRNVSGSLEKKSKLKEDGKTQFDSTTVTSRGVRGLFEVAHSNKIIIKIKIKITEKKERKGDDFDSLCDIGY